MTDCFSRLAAALADRYTIEREIGAGGMATVYLAEDLKLHRKVALKVLRPELAATLGPDRFFREIDIAAKLNHPHIVGLHDCGEAGGLLYYVMPYVEGESLREKLAKEGELPVADAVRILREVVDALAEAHSCGVVHRDIKPDNVMLRGRHALVTDFGVAKAVSDATGRRDLTTAGMALGTPAYMAPEQAAADLQIDHRADIYAVGAVAYELLTGRPPFTGTTPQEVLAAHVTQVPDPVTKYRESVPPALAELVSRCLEKKPADRWQTAEELLPQLETLATPSREMTPAATMSVDGVLKRRWMKVGGAGGVAIVIAVIAVLAALLRDKAVVLDPNHVVVAVLRNETGDPSLGQLGSRTGHWITQGLQHAAIPVTPWDIALQSWLYVQGETEAGRIRNPLQAFAEETGAGTVISGAVYLEGDSIEIQVDVTDATRGRLLGSPTPVTGGRDAQRELIGDVQEQVMVFLSVNFNEMLTDASPSLISAIPSFEAYQAFIRGRELQSAMDFEGAIPHYRKASELDSMWAYPLARLRQMLEVTGRVAESESVLVVLEGLWDGLSQYERAEVESFRAESDGDREAAVRALRRAVELAPNSGSLSNLGMQLWRLNRPREAVDLFLKVDPTRGWWREWVGYWHMLAVSFHMLGEYEQALEVTHRCRQVHPESSVCLENQSNALAALGRVNELNDVLDELEGLPNVPPYALVDVIEFLRYSGHADAAKEVADSAIRWFEARPPHEARRLDNRHEYGRALFFGGRSAEAQQVFDAIVDDYPEDVINRMHRAFIAASRGDTAQALSDAHTIESQAVQLDRFHKDEALLWCRGVIYGALGEQELAWELFRQFEPRWEHSAWDQVRVIYDPLRTHPGFREFMRPKG